MPKRRKSIAGIAKLIEQIPADVVVDLDVTIAQVAQAEAQRDGMASISPSFAGRRYGPYSLTTEIAKAKVRKDSASLIVYGTPAGFWTWLEEGVPRHEVGRARSRVSSERRSGRGGRRLAVDTPNGPRTHAHASMPPRGTWTRTVDEIETAVVELLEDRLDEIASDS